MFILIVFLLGVLGMCVLSILIPPLLLWMAFVRGCVAIGCQGLSSALSWYARYLETQWRVL